VLWRHDTYVPVPLGDQVSGVGDINRRADVVGHLSDGAAFLWRDGTLTRLAYPAGSPVWAAAVNDRDEVAGFRGVDDWAPDRPLVWRNGTFQDFPTWHVPSAGEAVGINNRSQVLVNLYAPDGSRQHALLWWHGAVTDLGSLGGGLSWAVALNETGTVLGWSTDAAGDWRPFRWEHGTMTDLTPTAAGWNGDITTLGENGDVVGQVDGHPALWRRGVLSETLADRYGVATAINDRGDLAGTTFDPVNPDIVRTPFRWRHDTVTTFGILYPRLAGTWVNAVDDRVIGISPAEGGADHIVIWTAH